MGEFSLAILVLFCFVIGITEICHAVWNYVQLTELARRGARYAVDHTRNKEAIQNVLVYGNPEGTGRAALPELKIDNVSVLYRRPNGVPADSDPANSSNTVIVVTIGGYEFRPWFNPSAQFGIGIGFRIPLPTARAALMAESQGWNY